MSPVVPPEDKNKPIRSDGLPKERSTRTYTSEHHRKAYEEWFRTRSFRAAANVIGDLPSLNLTVTGWSKENFHCWEGCPWHGWEKLAAATERQLRGRLAEIEDGDDSRALEIFNRKNQIDTRRDAISVTVRSNLERLIHWELIYAKLFYFCYGRVLPVAVNNDDGTPMTEEQLKEVYETGKQPKDILAAIRTMAVVQGEIDKLKDQAGVSPKAHQDSSHQGMEHMSLEKARKLTKLLEKIRPTLSEDELELLPDMLGMESAPTETIDVQP